MRVVSVDKMFNIADAMHLLRDRTFKDSPEINIPVTGYFSM